MEKTEEKIKILGIEYSIKRVPSISRDSYKAGQIDYENQEILILDTLKEDMYNTVLLHEIIHGALNHLGLVEESENENLVQGLAIAIHQVVGNIIPLTSS